MVKFNIENFQFLHVDDFANYRSMLKAILSSIGAKYMDDAKDAKDALELVKQKNYDVILCDYNLGSGQNGQQFLEEAMSRGLLPYGTIFIMITAENTMDMVMAAVEYRPDAYLSKPFPKELLIKRLQSLMSKKDIFKPIYKAFNKKEYTKAIKLCDKQMVDNRKLALDIGKLKAEIAIQAKQYDLAESLYDKALLIRPFDWALYGKGKALFEKTEYDKAEKSLKELLEQNKNYIEAYDILSKICTLKKDSGNAQKFLETATNISPRAISRQQELSNIAVHNGDFKIAEKALKSSIKLGKHSYLGVIDDHTNLTKLYIDNDKNSLAVKVLANARVEYKKDKLGIYHADVLESTVQHKLGNESRARELFEESVHNMPDDINNLSKSLQDAIIHNGQSLNETEMVQSLQDDINHPDSNSSSDRKAKYKYLLMNGKGMREYKDHKVSAAAKLFDEAAHYLTNNISVNMNAAQAYIMILREKPKNSQEIKEKVRKLLDVSYNLDKTNEKYQKLEGLYNNLL